MELERNGDSATRGAREEIEETETTGEVPNEVLTVSAKDQEMTEEEAEMTEEETDGQDKVAIAIETDYQEIQRKPKKDSTMS